MTVTNTQTTELSLDQLDDISAGFFGAALKGVKAIKKVATKRNAATAVIAGAGAGAFGNSQYSKGKRIWQRMSAAGANTRQKIFIAILSPLIIEVPKSSK